MPTIQVSAKKKGTKNHSHSVKNKSMEDKSTPTSPKLRRSSKGSSIGNISATVSVQLENIEKENSSKRDLLKSDSAKYAPFIGDSESSLETGSLDISFDDCLRKKERTVTNLSEGYYFGVFHHGNLYQTRSCSVWSLRNCHLLRIDKATWKEVVKMRDARVEQEKLLFLRSIPIF